MKAQLKELQQLNPKRLEKVNREQKKRITELKATNAQLDAARKTANKAVTEAKNQMAQTGTACFFIEPETGNGLRFLNLSISKENDMGGVPHTPIVEFMHKARGICRQGFLDVNGKIKWASANNSTPSDLIDTMAKQAIVDYCKKKRIKI